MRVWRDAVTRGWRLASAGALVGLIGCGEPAGQDNRGQLIVNVSGLPNGTPGLVTVGGPNSLARSLTATTTLSSPPAGDYEVGASTSRTDSVTHAPRDTVQRLRVGTSPVSATVTYVVVTGRLAIILEGLPSGARAPVTVSGPGGFGAVVMANDTIENLAPGTYTLSASPVTTGGDTYNAVSAQSSVDVPASLTPAVGRVRYQRTSGTITILINGLPAGVAASVRVDGPGGVPRTVTASGPVPGLVAGLYTVTADTVTAPSGRFAPIPRVQLVSLSQAGGATATVNYVAVTPGPATNLSIAGAYLTQVIQTFGGAVPLVEGRLALLRVFVLASAEGVTAPAVRVRLYSGGTLASTVTIQPPSTTAPTSVNEGTLSGSWNTLVPAALVKSGLEVLVDVDPTNAVAESDETDNVWPAGGTPLLTEVRTTPNIAVRFVPVQHTATGLTGRISASNLDAFLTATRKLMPTARVDGIIAAPFVTSAPALVPDDSNDAWARILSEINALRAAEGGTGVYFGVLQTPYSSGIAGLAFINGRAALGWDFLPSASIIVAHELGHSFGRLHAPCGQAGGIDVSYPYPRATIGVYGWDPEANGVIAPTASDVMSYCAPVWISDYTYTAIMNHLLLNGGSVGARAASRQAEPSYLIWGRVSRGRPILEPAFEIDAPAQVNAPGSDVIEFVEGNGTISRAITFRAERVPDATDPTAAQFALVVPSRLVGAAPAEIRVRLASGSAASQRRSPTTSAPRVEREDNASLGVKWTGRAPRASLVRDPATGRVLGIIRGDASGLRTSSASLDVLVSDGVRSTRHRVTVAPGRGR